MARYINKYADATAIKNAVESQELSKPYVAYDESAQTIDWNTQNPTPDYSKEYLTFNIISGGTIVWKASHTAITKTIQYSLDNGTTWTSITSAKNGVSFNVNAGDKILFKGDNTAYGNGNNNRYNSFNGSTAIFNVYGNIMSLISSTNYENLTTVNDSAFLYLFEQTNIVDVSNLVLPATTLGTQCYKNMFRNCTSLTTAPELPATTLGNFSYSSMFYGCTTLNYIKCLATTNINASDWVYGVASSGTFVKKSGVYWPSGQNGIPLNWTVQEV